MRGTSLVVAGIVAVLMLAIIPAAAAQNQAVTSLMEDGLTFMPGNKSMSAVEQHLRIREMCQHGVAHKMFGALTYSDGVASGYFIRFNYDERTGEITDYEVRTGDSYTEIFKWIELVDFRPEGVMVHGSILNQYNDTARMIVHNNPTAMVHVAVNASSAKLSMALADGLDVTVFEPAGELDAAVRIDNASFHAVIGVSNGTISVGEVENITLVNITVNEGQAFFRMRPSFTIVGAENEELVEDAIINGKIAAEVALMYRDGNGICIEQTYHHQYRMQVISMNQNRIQLQVSAENHEGKVMMLKFDRETFDSSGGIQVTIDGNEIKSSASINGVIEASGDQMEDARYYIYDNGQECVLLTYIPSFSTHTLTIEPVAGTDLTSLAVIGLVVAIALIVVIAVLVRK